MTSDKIIEICKECRPKFEKILENESYQLRGIFNSEALMIVSLARYFKVNHLIESGRARGHSTNLFAKFFSDESDLKITSIDYDSSSKDAAYSEKVLAKYENLELIYGDSRKVIKAEIFNECVVFIDGPKGDEAIKLAVELLHDKRVLAVMIHDLHKGAFSRNISEMIFNHHFFSDDSKFVESFNELDDECWQRLRNEGHAPYIRYNKPMLSYASTLGVFFNSKNPIDLQAYENFLADRKYHELTLKNLVRSTIPQNSFLFKILFLVYKKTK